MTPLFVNSYSETVEDLKEQYFFSYIKNYKPYLVYAVFSIIYVLGVKWFFPYISNIFLFVAPFVFFMLFLAIHYIKYRINLKRAIAAFTETINMKPTNYVKAIYDDKIDLFKNGILQTTIEFSRIKIARQSKSYIILCTTKVGYLLRKDSFTVGTVEQFCEFLRSKGYKITLK